MAVMCGENVLGSAIEDVMVTRKSIQTPIKHFRINVMESLPEDMPDDLKRHITRERSMFQRLGKTVWLSCGGELSVDVENVGPIRYLPRRGFPGYFFPYNNTENYLSPLVAIYFEKPQKGIVINVECRIWAKNIEYNKERGTGFVHFELMVDY
ncbi:Sodium/potassium-transporting ATPase subunit beta-2 [Blattella germanica]|nr:Sodium/potassium-transporting ATPase subunit beta-2 [Blattella germanica]